MLPHHFTVFIFTSTTSVIFFLILSSHIFHFWLNAYKTPKCQFIKFLRHSFMRQIYWVPTKPDPVSDTNNKILSTANRIVALRDTWALNKSPMKKYRMTNCLSLCINILKDEKQWSFIGAKANTIQAMKLEKTSPHIIQMLCFLLQSHILQ